MRMGQTWTTEERSRIEALCQQNHELLIRLEFDLGIERPVENMSTRDLSFLVRLQIERMNQDIAELKESLRRAWHSDEEETPHD